MTAMTVTMRTIPPPEELPVTALPGVGSLRSRALADAGIATVRDLLAWYPRRYLDRSTIVPMTDLYRHRGSVVTAIGRITGIVLLGRGRKRLVVTLRDLQGSMDIVFFQGLPFWQKAFTQDEVLAVSGEIAFYGARPNMVHPDIDRLQDEETMDFINTGGIVPVYPSNAALEKVGLNRHGGFRKLMHAAVQQYAPALVDPYDGTSMCTRHRLIPLQRAMEWIHRPPSQQQLDFARRRLVFDEFFRLTLQAALTRQRNRSIVPGISFHSESPAARDLVRALPFALTSAQRRVIREITGDMARPEPMNRLLQGDVGSGKTVVALLAMLVAIDNGFQAALMVPTEILAEQHYRTISRLVNDLRIPVRLLTGQQSASERSAILAEISDGRASIVVGTHALIQEDVAFARLGFLVIDEQHRFGVLQRAALRGKGAMPDVLVMTATPIPRTLSMTLYGDLDVSVIDELPANRRNIRTAIRFEEDRGAVWDFVRSEIAAHSQVYVVFPLVSQSEKLDLRAATEEFETLAHDVFPDARVGLLHGQMSAKEKDGAMQQFARGELDILVSTTVVEVGVDVPNATVMVIEHAERFGLAQLHQLRGRVGRGEKQGTCILMTEKRVFFGTARGDEEKRAMSDARRRLETMRDSIDGFRIAEIDMEIRGPGDLWGTQQSGFPELRIASLLEHGDILQEARDEAFRIIDEDPHLRKPGHAHLRRIAGTELRDSITAAGVA